MPFANPFAKYTSFLSNWSFWWKSSGKNAKRYSLTAAASVEANLSLPLSIPSKRFRSFAKKLLKLSFQNNKTGQ